MYYLPFFVVFLLLFGTDSQAKEPIAIRSAVSADFPDGLHSKYLHYVAQKLDMALNIDPMSFPRRLNALESGELDLLVGIQASQKRQGLIYLKPAYQILASTFFVRNGEQGKLSKYTDLAKKRIAVTPRVSYFSDFDQDKTLAKVELDSLQQKIKLLVNNRVDTFIHNKDSTLVTLKVMGLRQDVALADYQPKDKRHYYFVISIKSRLYPHIDKLRQIIERGVSSGDFSHIRKQHYQALARKAKANPNVAAAFE